MLTKITLIVLVSFIYLINADGIFKDCGSIEGAFTDVVVNNCKPTDKACILKRNTNASISITFTIKEPTESVTAIVHGKVFGAEIPFPLPNSNACFKSGILCPLAEGGPYTYEATLPVLKQYPKLFVEVKWQLVNSQKQNIVCVIIPAKIE